MQDGRIQFVVKDPKTGKQTPTTLPIEDVVEVSRKDEPRSSPKSAVAAKASPSTAKPIAAVKKPSTAPSAASAKIKPSTAPAVVVDPEAIGSTVLLAEDDHLTGAVGHWTDKQISVRTADTGDQAIDVPVEQIRQIWCGPPDKVNQAKALASDQGLDDVAFVTSDTGVTAVKGLVLGVEGDALKFRFGGKDRKIALNRLVGVTFAPGADVKKDESFHQSIRLGGDDVISGKWRSLAGGKIDLETRWGAHISIPWTAVSTILSRNGRLVYVSDLKPAKVEQTPYFDRVMPYQNDKSLLGKPIILSDGGYAKGISVHSRCVLTYDVGGKFDEFKAHVGFQLPEGKLGDAAVRVLGDDRVLFEKPDARGDAKPFDVAVSLAGVSRLALEVDFGNNQDVGDRVVWANARLLRARVNP